MALPTFFAGGGRRLLLTLVGVAILGASALIGYLIWSGQRELVAGAEQTTRSFTAMIDANIDSTLRRIDVTLRTVGETVPRQALDKARVPEFAADIDRQLDQHLRSFPELAGIRVFDAAGDMLYTTDSVATARVNIADRAHFRKLRDDARADVVFSEVLVTRTTGRSAILVGRALRGERGRFLGMIVAHLDLEHFEHLLAALDIGRQGVIAVHRSDDHALVLRRPALADAVNRPLPPDHPLVPALASGQRTTTLHFTAPGDGIERFASVSRLERYPYFVVVGLSSQEVLGGLRIRVAVVGSAGLLLLGLLGFLLSRLVTTERERERIVAELSASSMRLLEHKARLDDALDIGRMADCSYDIAAGRFELGERFHRLLRRECVDGGGGADERPTVAEFAARLVHPADAALVDAALARALEPDADHPPEEPLRLLCSDGSPRWMLLRFQRAPTGAGEHLNGTLIDIHERREAGQAFRDLSAFQSAILEAADYSIISTTPDGAITSFNLAAERMLGYRAEEVIGMVTPAVIHDPAEVAARAAEFSADLGIAIKPGFEVFVARSRQHLPNTYEWTYVRKDGSRFPVLLSVTAMRDDSGAVTGFMGIAADITVQRQAVAALHESEAALNAAQAVAHVGSWTLDILANRLDWSAETYRIFGISPDTPLTYQRFVECVHPEDRVALEAAWQAAMAGADYDIEHRLLVNGQVRWVRERAQIVFDARRRPISGVGTVQDITERKQAELQLQLLARVFQHSGEALVVTDRDNNILEVNPAFTRSTGYSIDDVRGRNPRILAAGRTPPEVYAEMWHGILTHNYWQGELWDRRKDGSVYPKLLTIAVVRDAGGAITHHIGGFTDISRQKANEEEIRNLALHDALTGLPNRLNLQGRLEQAIAAGRRDRQQVAVMFLDLDRFKRINDRLGHAVGDLLLIEVARRLKASVRDADVVARLGGDEFVVVLPNVADSVVAGQVADKIVAALDQPYSLDGHSVESSPSIGIALYPADGEDGEILLKRADEAMYRAKSMGRNNWQFYVS
ncbi:MAG: PAS domain S-box protein [Gammaproteobacteria bacterium]|nr:PAS domain S-box protein [Gammaproteobacteria bacterium]MBU1646897.1 PAS domain S-box protein [Gammaproteobacteria bacterium]MBU1971158.1 PAS domain S-box protein [Gammaproteobacteria bacterium]